MGHSSIDIPTIFFFSHSSAAKWWVRWNVCSANWPRPSRPAISCLWFICQSRPTWRQPFHQSFFFFFFSALGLLCTVILPDGASRGPMERMESAAAGCYWDLPSPQSRTGTLSKFSVFFFFLRECVCFVLIVISYPQQLHGSITETTTHGTSTIYRESDSCCAEEVRDYWVYKVNDEFYFLLFFLCVRIDIAFRLKQSPSSTNLERFTGPTNDICCAREFLNNVIAPTFCLKSFLNKCTRREVNKFFK